MIPVFKTSNSEFIQKCGLDAYLFLRFLRMLLRIFLPLACVVLPVLLPINAVRNTSMGKKGLDVFGWGNIDPNEHNKYWAHLLIAILVIAYTSYVFYDELRKYVRLRQAYLTSPQHRLRASATTVLVRNIPRKWLTLEALDALYDVFPGGIRNIWINRDFSDLQNKLDLRNKYALALESAETELVRKCVRAHKKQLKEEAKKAGAKKKSRAEQKADDDNANRIAEEKANQAGVSSGDPGNVPHTLHDALDEAGSDASSVASSINFKNPIAGVKGGVDAVGRGVNKLGETIKGGLLGGFRKAKNEFNEEMNEANAGNGFAGGAGPSAAGERDPSPRQLDGTNDEKWSRDDVEMQDMKPVSTRRPAEYIPKTRPDYTPTARTNASEMKPVEPEEKNPRKSRALFKSSKPVRYPSPQPFRLEGDDVPLNDRSDEKNEIVYEKEYDENFDFTGHDMGAAWNKYIKPSDRETMRIPLFPSTTWFPSLPLIGKKVDKIYHCRQIVAKLNTEIEVDQRDPERFPLMNSAFIQFNHQVAAHMACQSLNHHIPSTMTPRMVEVSPHDVIWDNLKIPWWQMYIRTAGVVAIVGGLVIFWAIPVFFTALLSNVQALADAYTWLRWVTELPQVLLSVIQGILPVLLLAILLALLPIVMRFLATLQGVPTGIVRELWVSNYYFAFLFIQVFLVVSITSGFSNAIAELLANPLSIASVLADNLPLASNYFFSYMILQALSVSAGALLQVAALLSWFVLSKVFDNSAREKFNRQIKLPEVQWGSFFPIYTNLAVIGLVYSVISPLIVVFNIITFGLFWVVYRYQTLYVNRYRIDTGGLLFPKAINQMFTGLYVMELCLVGLFFLNRDSNGAPTSVPQAIIMIVTMFMTVGFQFFLNSTFGPLFQYIPITMEDDAVLRDEEFARAQDKRFNLAEEEQDGDNLTHVLEERERREEEEERAAARAEEADIADRRAGRRHSSRGRHLSSTWRSPRIGNTVWGNTPADGSPRPHQAADGLRNPATAIASKLNPRRARRSSRNPSVPPAEKDIESQNPMGDVIFAGIADEIEDLLPEERDRLVRRAFMHEALRARVPCVWIPQDELGVGADEIARTRTFAGGAIWISNEYSALDAKSRVLFKKAPPDFSEIDLIEL